MIIKNGGGRMEGKLSWLDDRQQLAIKTSQGWREVQVNRNRNLSVLSFHFNFVEHYKPHYFIFISKLMWWFLCSTRHFEGNRLDFSIEL